MSNIKLSDDNNSKCNALKSIGIIVKHYDINNKRIYYITIDGFPDADKFIETTFKSINDIVLAFSDRLINYRVIIA
jgi:hypothetical protein